MGRARIPLTALQCDKRRKLCFLKRVNGLKKKLSELATLCDIDVCMLCWGPNGCPVETWPAEKMVVNRMIRRYEEMPENTKKRKHADVSSILKDETEKLQRELDRKRAKNGCNRYPSWDSRLDGMSESSLRELTVKIDMKLEKVRERINTLKQENWIVKQKDQHSTVVKDSDATILLPYPTPLHCDQMSSYCPRFYCNFAFPMAETLSLSDEISSGTQLQSTVGEDSDATILLPYPTPLHSHQMSSYCPGFYCDMAFPMAEMPSLSDEISSGTQLQWTDDGSQDFNVQFEIGERISTVGQINVASEEFVDRINMSEETGLGMVEEDQDVAAQSHLNAALPLPHPISPVLDYERDSHYPGFDFGVGSFDPGLDFDLGSCDPGFDFGVGSFDPGLDFDLGSCDPGFDFNFDFPTDEMSVFDCETISRNPEQNIHGSADFNVAGNEDGLKP